jgi:predicted GTPase
MLSLDFTAFEQHIEKYDLLMPLDVLIVGAAGVGKSSTINALGGRSLAQVGFGVAPETMHIKRHPLDEYFHVHDSAGLGDGSAADASHRTAIAAQLKRLCYSSQGYVAFKIDLVLVILDAGNRDLGTAYKLVSEVILTNIEPDRVMVVINQADMAMKGNGWVAETNRPNQELADFLKQQAVSFKNRIRESTGLTLQTPVHYSALKGYNLQDLLNFIVLHLPKRRRRWQAADLVRSWVSECAKAPGDNHEGSSA